MIQISGYFNLNKELILQADCTRKTALRPNEDWRNNKFIGFEDGGNAFFWAQINLNQMIVTELWPNGIA